MLVWGDHHGLPMASRIEQACAALYSALSSPTLIEGCRVLRYTPPRNNSYRHYLSQEIESIENGSRDVQGHHGWVVNLKLEYYQNWEPADVTPEGILDAALEAIHDRIGEDRTLGAKCDNVHIATVAYSQDVINLKAEAIIDVELVVRADDDDLSKLSK